MTDGESHPVNVSERHTQNDGWEEPEVSSDEPPRLTRRAGQIDAAPHNGCPSGRSREIILRPRSARCHHAAFGRSCRPTYGQCMTPCANSSTRRSLFTRTHGTEPCPVTLVSAGRTFNAADRRSIRLRIDRADAVSDGNDKRTRFRALAKAPPRALFDRFDRPQAEPSAKQVRGRSAQRL